MDLFQEQIYNLETSSAQWPAKQYEVKNLFKSTLESKNIFSPNKNIIISIARDLKA